MIRLLDTNTRYFDQDSFDKPVFTNNWGSMVEAFDAVLIDGGSPKEVLSLSFSELENYWEVVLTVNTGHGFKENLSVIEIKNCSELIFNGLHRVQEIASDSFKILVHKSDNNTPTQVLSTLGMTVNLAPLGFEKIFEESFKRVYKTYNPLGKEVYLRIDNSCPPNYDPSFSKFSRVSMYSDIDSIDDVDFKVGRYKAPAKTNYLSVEEDRSDVWLGVRNSASASEFQVKNSSYILNLEEFFILGDSKTFYFYIKDILPNNLTYMGDCLYTFGEYTKLMYKEDPYPFLITTSEKYDENLYLRYNQPGAYFWQNSFKAKYLFNTEINYNFTKNKSDSWNFWLNETYTSSIRTLIDFKPYKNELVFNLFEKLILTARPEGTFLEGKLRGITDIMANLTDTPEIAPEHGDIIESDTLYLITKVRNYHLEQQLKFAFKLANWS